jgi:hypothetical protein
LSREDNVQLSAILLARALAFFEVVDINPPGGLFFPDLTRELLQRFNFQKYPRNFDEWKDDKGAIFASGKLGKVTVDNLTLFNNGIQVDTHSGTDESKRILEETLQWAREKLGFSYRTDLKIRWAYVSNLTFVTDVPILSNPPLDNLAERTSRAMAEVVGNPIVYMPTAQSIGHDPLTVKWGRAPLSIQRRLEVPFSDNKYFSESPLPTDVHINLLKQFEADVKATFGARTTDAGGRR